METNKTTTEQLEAARATAAVKLAELKTTASQHLATAGTLLDELRDQAVAGFHATKDEIDADAIKAEATAKVESFKAEAADHFGTLQATATEAYASAAAKFDALKDQADDQLDVLKAEAAEHLAAAEVRLDELAAQASVQAEAITEKAKSFFGNLFAKKSGE